MIAPSPAEQPDDTADITDGGERVTHLQRNHVFYAHLSLYAFASQWASGAQVLDAGSGSGYGSAYLAEAGAARVWGIDVSPKAVEFSRHHFDRPHLTFQVMDLSGPLAFADRQFDLIYTSNTLEHIANVAVFLREAWRLLAPGGRLVLAVPPIVTDDQLCLNLINPYHVNLWSPRQWQHALGQYFAQIEPYVHGIRRLGTDFESLAPEELADVTEKSFVFEPTPVDLMYAQPTLTAVFVLSQPRAVADLPAAGAPMSFVDDSFTRAPGYIDPALRRRLRRQFDRFQPPPPAPPKELTLLQKTVIIARQEGPLALAKSIATYPLRLWRTLRGK